MHCPRSTDQCDDSMNVATKARMGYSLLELMLALTLLAALSAVGWSLLGTYRDAELRGWRLAHRTQTLRTLRDCLENDLQQMIAPAESLVSLTSTMPASMQTTSFVGSASGFTIRCTPSLDPLPFLERLTHSTEVGTRSSGIESLDQLSPGAASSASLSEPTLRITDSNTIAVAALHDTAWPSEVLDVEYRLTPIGRSGPGSASLLTDPTADVASLLTRREHWVDGSGPDLAQGTSASPADRVLTTEDLYRQTDTSADALGPLVGESQWWGLTRAKFQYFDGQAWRGQWNSTHSGTLPQAIAVSFDFVNNDQLNPSSLRPTSQQSNDADAEFSLENFQSFPTMEDAALVEEAQAASNSKPLTPLAASGTHQVHMVFVVEQSLQATRTLSPALPGTARSTSPATASNRSGGLP